MPETPASAASHQVEVKRVRWLDHPAVEPGQ